MSIPVTIPAPRRALRAALQADSYCRALLHLARDARDAGYRHTMRAASLSAIRHARHARQARA